ncbi:hypothetical protein HJC23_003424 [Cyclotella cryptica]|uniref:Uncharacterized protein n=1 Tax=Cyclotella cryptica TaxID=29204 RepID=A0ABD3QSJ3_9STRA|eukprot:CCRYP_002559-RA/>CCRYP_002559-RA protein AED:0.00 eAED:0.00 QI:146/1/1/1/0/0/2/677/631
MPSPIPARPSSPSNASAPTYSTLIHDATVSSTQIFAQHAASVLKHSSSSFLKRRLSQKLQSQLRGVPYEALKHCDAESVVSTFCHPPLEISEQDVVDCETFAERVGNQWAKVLRQRGYVEFANVLLNFVEEGNFLQGSNNEKQSSTDEEPTVLMNQNTEENDSLTKKFMTPYAALSSLRRYQPDCDASGRPFEHIPTLSDRDSNGTSSARKVIHHIDRLMQNIDSKDLKATYGYDWDAITEAVKRNEKRLYIFQRNPEHDEDEYEVVPKIYVQKNETTEDSDAIIRDSNTLHREKVVQFEDGSHPIVDTDKEEKANTDFLISTHPRLASILRRKRYREEYNQYDDGDSADDLHEIQKGRPPSTTADTHWTWNDILDDIPILERRKLIRETIHPPFPVIKNEEEDLIDVADIPEKEDCTSRTDDESNNHSAADVEAHSAVVCGALRSFGSTHLWEQTCNCPLNNEQYQTTDDETQQHGNMSLGRVAEETMYGVAETQKTYQSHRLLKLQKRTLRRAIKERTAPRSLILSDMKSEYNDGMGKKNKSKVKWTESCQENDIGRETKQQIEENTSEEIPTQQLETTSSPSELWLEMDLGQCTIEITDDNDNEETQTENTQTKRMLAFRSLELALRF